MENIGDIRYKNTRLLINSHCDPKRAIKDFAQRIGVQPGYASGMASPDPDKRSRPIGGAMARRIETAFNVEKYWLDTPHYTGGSSHSIQEDKAEYLSEGEQVHIIDKQSVPLLTEEQIKQWIDGDRSIPANMKFPLLPMMPTTSSAYVIEELTNSMPPKQPGDFYYVDPDMKPEPGKMAVYLINSRYVVGNYEIGVRGERLTFTNPREEAIDVSEAVYAGRVLTHMTGEFIALFGGMVK